MPTPFGDATCPLMRHAAPTGCDWCATPLTGRATRWCSRKCRDRWMENHVWVAARECAKRRARLRGHDGPGGDPQYRCAHCGIATPIVEVNHKDPVLGKHGDTGCWHHQDGLEVLCRPCHLAETARQFGFRSASEPRTT